jgi:heat shock protein HslJ
MRSVSSTQRSPRSLRPVVALAAVAALALAACSSGASPSAEPSTEPGMDAVPFEGTTWQLVEYASEGGAALPVPEAVAATATFADGVVSGNGGCNSFTGPYTLDGDTLAIGDLASTMMACEGPRGAVETAFLAIFPKVTTVAVDGETLELTGDGGKLILRFTVAEAAELTGTTWSATGINNGKEAVQSLVAGTEVTAIFAEDGTVAGSGGCNSFNGTYTVDGAGIAFGPVASTKMACEQAVMDQETAFFAALAASSTYAISGDALELRDADGALQVGFTATVATE